MTGFKLRLAAWCAPLVISGGFALHLQHLRHSDPGVKPALDEKPAAEATTVNRPAAPHNDSTATVPAETRAFERLREELSGLRARVVQREQQLRAAAQAAPNPTTQPPPPLTDAFLTPEQWRDAGNKSPAALMESLLWAGAGGDLARVAEMLLFTPEAHAAAEALWQSLPPDLRPAETDASALITLLATDAVPLKPVTLAGDFPLESGDHNMILQVDPDPAAPGPRSTDRLRFVKLMVRQANDNESWQIVVTPEAVASMAAKLRPPIESP